MNTQPITSYFFIPTTLAMAMTLNACGGGSSSSTSRSGASSEPSTLTISITDSVIDSAQEVWIQFTGVTIQPADGDAIDFTFNNAKDINLLSLQGTRHTDLVHDETVPLGNYDWIRLNVNASNDGNNDSYIKLDDGSVHELWIPSGSQTGLKINTGFEVTETNELKLMIDFDLRKSVVESAGEYKLRPTLRMVDMDDVSNITGSIDLSLITDASCSDADPTTGNAVYLFEGANIMADDMDNQTPEPLTSARVELNTSSGDYEYMIAFIPEGDYTLAFTCQADLDDPTSNDNILFGSSENITVVVENDDEDDDSLPDPVRKSL